MHAGTWEDATRHEEREGDSHDERPLDVRGRHADADAAAGVARRKRGGAQPPRICAYVHVRVLAVCTCVCEPSACVCRQCALAGASARVCAGCVSAVSLQSGLLACVTADPLLGYSRVSVSPVSVASSLVRPSKKGLDRSWRLSE